MKKIALLLIVFLLMGCSDSGISQDTLDALESTIEKELEDLKDEVDDMQDDIKDKDDLIDELEERLEIAETMVSGSSSERREAFISIYESGYSIADTDIGPLLVYVEEAVPYMNGLRVSLVIGNPNYVTYLGLGLDVACYDSLENEQGNFQTIDLADTIESGSWTTVELTIPLLDVEDADSLMIKMNSDRVRLY